MRMRIGGLQKLSLIDYPGRVAAVVFTQGCNFRCPFCHNTSLVIPSCFQDPLAEEEILSFLEKRVGKLQGVVVTGGEPTIQPDLPEFLRKIKGYGYSVKLDTNGSRPHILADLIAENLVDFIAMDIKAPLTRYDALAGVRVNPDNIRKSIQLILGADIKYEFRTTVPKPLMNDTDIEGIVQMIGEAHYYRLQPFTPNDNVLDSLLLDQGHYTEEEFSVIRKSWERFPVKVTV